MDDFGELEVFDTVGEKIAHLEARMDAQWDQLKRFKELDQMVRERDERIAALEAGLGRVLRDAVAPVVHDPEVELSFGVPGLILGFRSLP